VGYAWLLTCMLRRLIRMKALDSARLQGRSESNAALSGEARKQDCELTALSRLLPRLRQDFPELRLCLSGDSLYA